MIEKQAKEQLAALALGQPCAKDSGIFGADIDPRDAGLILIPVPFDLTTSYGKGTINGPAAIAKASLQLDLCDEKWGPVYKAGIAMLPEEARIRDLSVQNAPFAEQVISAVEQGASPAQSRKALAKVNEATREVTGIIATHATTWLAQNKCVGLVGGDHSCTLGMVQALARGPYGEGFGILHIDAHHDLRVAYEGFVHSHASVMYNVIQEIPEVTQLVSVAIRDFSEQEKQLADTHPKIRTFYDAAIFRALSAGTCFSSVASEIIEALPRLVYISFDIDGLDPVNCPSTGTPVPGGLTFQQAVYLIERLHDSGRTVIGFDLCEVAPALGDEWDGNVGARILYKLAASLIRSQQCPDLL